MHRATAAGHIAYIVDESQNICKSSNTGVWINKKYISCDSKGQIFIPYKKSAKNVLGGYIEKNPKLTKIILINED